MEVESTIWEPGTKPGSAGRDGGCDGVRCGSGSLSDDVDEELEEDDDELGWGPSRCSLSIRFFTFSRSSNSRYWSFGGL